MLSYRILVFLSRVFAGFFWKVTGPDMLAFADIPSPDVNTTRGQIVRMYGARPWTRWPFLWILSRTQALPALSEREKQAKI